MKMLPYHPKSAWYRATEPQIPPKKVDQKNVRRIVSWTHHQSTILICIYCCFQNGSILLWKMMENGPSLLEPTGRWPLLCPSSTPLCWRNLAAANLNPLESLSWRRERSRCCQDKHGVLKPKYRVFLQLLPPISNMIPVFTIARRTTRNLGRIGTPGTKATNSGDHKKRY